MKDDNPKMLTIHCVIHKENLVAKKISPILNETLLAVIKCINSIKSSAKSERLFKLFCEEKNEDYCRLLLHTEVRWLSKGNCLRRFMELYDSLKEFLNDKSEMKFLDSPEGKIYLSYLTDVFGMLNLLNKSLQGSNKTIIDARTKIFGFITNIELKKRNLMNRNFEQFHWLKKCQVSDEALHVILNHLDVLIIDFNERFLDLKNINIPLWITQPILVDLAAVEGNLYQEELAEFRYDESAIFLFKSKGVMCWLCDEIKSKYPYTTEYARKLLLPFPSSYLAECGFSVVNDILTKKRNRLDITQRGDLRLKLTKMEPDIKSLCVNHQVQNSH
jgi:hypothetical protein